MAASDLGRWISLEVSRKHAVPMFVFWSLDVLAILSYTVPSSPKRPFLFFIPLLCISLWLLLCTRPDHESLGFSVITQIGVGCHLAIGLFLGSTNILLSNPQEDLKLLGFSDTVVENGVSKKDDDLKNHVSTKPISSEPFLRRLWWAVILWGNPRGINFAHEPTSSLPPRPSRAISRSAYIASRVFWIIFYVCQMDIATSVLEMYDARRRSSAVLGRADSMAMWRLLSLSYWVYMYAVNIHLLEALSIVSITARITAPSDWPPLYNSVREAYTVRRFWGKFWHQMFRRSFGLHGSFFSDMLGLPPKSIVTTYFKLFLSFFMSALLHYAGDAMALQTLGAVGCIKFFMMQPIGILFEDAFLGLVKRLTGRRTSTPILRAIGYVWVLLWIGFTGPLWMDDQFEGGYVGSLRKDYPRVVSRAWASKGNK